MKTLYKYTGQGLLYLCVLLFNLAFINTGVIAKPVGIDLARQVAENWLSQVTRTNKKSIDVIVDGKVSGLSTGAGSLVSASYYIITMEQGGWVIVSGDDVVQPIIGYSTEGEVGTEGFPPAFRDWMDGIKAAIEAVVQSDEVSPANNSIAAAIQSAWDNPDISNYGINNSTIGAVAPLVTTTWSQGKYYNASCPLDSSSSHDGHALVGCCATAIGQVMKYHNWPDRGVGANSYYHSKYGTLSANFGATDYQWSSMPSSGRVTSYNNAVATLLSHVGISINMDYGPTSSGCSPAKIATSLGPNFKYKPVTFVWRSSSSDAAWKASLKNDLDASRPIVYVGSGTGGHAFVLDGYQGSDYFHFNWGWNGSYDGYFYIDNLNPGGSNFNSGQGAILGIEPAGQAPGKATLIAPKGWISDSTPTYTWNVVSGATQYLLWVNDVNGNRVKQTYSSSGVCGSSTCSVTPSIELADGAGRWWIRAGNSHGNGPWSAEMDFRLSAAGHVTGTSTPITPEGRVLDDTPTYTWSTVGNVSWTRLWVNDRLGNKIQRWYPSSQTCSGSSCSVTPATRLENGDATWWVQSWSPYGYGYWSSPKNFYVLSDTQTGIATPVSPSGDITDNTPTYSWNTEGNVTYTYLWVNDSYGNRIRRWYPSAEACSGGSCSADPDVILMDGSAKWWVLPWSQYGYGEWSSPMSFNEVSSGGFNSQFNGGAPNWFYLNVGAPWYVSSQYLYTHGLPTTFASIYYGPYSDANTAYDDFDYQVKLWRNGSNYVSNGIMFRGNPNPRGAIGSWDHGYGFYYTRSGHYSIWRFTDGNASAIQPWTYSSAINRGSAWNVPRVRAIGNTVYFYINGVYLGRLTNASYHTGKVGVMMYRGNEAGTMWADYAKLSVIDAGTLNSVEVVPTADTFDIDESTITENSVSAGNGGDAGVGYVSDQKRLYGTQPEVVPEIEMDE